MSPRLPLPAAPALADDASMVAVSAVAERDDRAAAAGPRRGGERHPHHVPTVDTQRRGMVTFRVCGRIVNRLSVCSDHGGRHGDTAQVSACRRILQRQVG